MTDGRRPQSPGSPLRGRYLVRNPAWNLAIRAADTMWRTVPARRTGDDRIHDARRILVAVGGHLGDAVLATSIIPQIVAAYPAAEIGMLLPSWSRQVVEGHHRVRWIHHVDHWRMNRGGRSSFQKWQQFRLSSAVAAREIGAIGYDVALDLYPFYPNASRLLWRAGVPMRVGYESGGGGPLYTHPVAWSPVIGHTVEQHELLLRRLVGARAQLPPPGYDLPAVSERRIPDLPSDYIVLHPGTGDSQKAWPNERWRSLADGLTARGARVVVTGAGEREGTLAASLAERGDVLNLVGRLSWPELRAVLAGARCVVGADSVAVHLTAAAGTPVVAIMAAMSDPAYWRPLGERVITLTAAQPCAPCFLSRGCDAMACVREVGVDDVMSAYLHLVAEPRQRMEKAHA